MSVLGFAALVSISVIEKCDNVVPSGKTTFGLQFIQNGCRAVIPTQLAAKFVPDQQINLAWFSALLKHQSRISSSVPPSSTRVFKSA